MEFMKLKKLWIKTKASIIDILALEECYRKMKEGSNGTQDRNDDNVKD